MTEEIKESPALSPQTRADKHSSEVWQVLWFFVHLAAVYLIVQFVTPWLAGWTHTMLVPILRSPSGRFQFFFSHLLAFSFIPAFVSGLASARFKHRAAEFVWLVPTMILAYKFVTFPAPSVFQSQLSAAFHQYFGCGFIIPDASNFHDLFMFSANYDMMRGIAQHQFTAPFYAGIGYSLATWVGRRTQLRERTAEVLKAWRDPDSSKGNRRRSGVVSRRQCSKRLEPPRRTFARFPACGALD
jgi:hypothetical protein